MRALLSRLLTPAFNPFSEAYARDPYPHLAVVRASAPVHFNRALGSYVVSTYRDVSDVLGDRRFSADRFKDRSLRSRILVALIDAQLSREGRAALRANLTTAADADHLRLRASTRGTFARASVEQLRPRLEALAHRLLERAAARGELDVIADYASPLPMLAIALLLGLPEEDVPQLEEWSKPFVFLVDPSIRGVSLSKLKRAFVDLDRYLRARICEKRAKPDDDMISRLLVEQQKGRLGEDELRVLCLTLLTSGHETTTNAIGNSVAQLLRAPEIRARVQQNPELLPDAFEEFLRLESPIQSAWRVATEDGSIGAQRVPRGSLVTLLIGAANRDPERFAEPDEIRLDRRAPSHVAFGYGAHYCVGTALARLQGEIALGSLLARFPGFSALDSSLAWKPALGLRGLYHLRVRV